MALDPTHHPLALARFYESYYQRIFPNQSWDRSLHYLMLNAPSGNPLRTPFPPHGSAISDGTARRAAPAPRSPEPRGASQSAQPAQPAQPAQRPTKQRGASVGTDTNARTTRPVSPAQTVQSPSGPPPPPAPRARKTASFAERLKQRASAHEQGAQGS